MSNMSAGLYIQVPFCQTKCTYCNFHTGVFSSSLYEPYARAVCREIEIRASSTSHSFDTVYFGGGTPSLLAPASLARIFEAFRSHFTCEIEEATLEADPETITREKADAWFAMGFNRISLGAQSFNDVELKAAGRMHRRDDIFSAMEILRAAGFRNLSLDLIAGLAHQTPQSWQDSVENLLRSEPQHISIYIMEIDEGSHLGKESLAGGKRYSAEALPSDDAMVDSYELACERLAMAGFEHYEISNWSRPRFRSRHNIKYWRREPYLGLGAGAHSFNGTTRWANAHEPAAYVAAIERRELPVEQEVVVTRQQALEESLFLGLRQLEGIDLAPLAVQFGGALRGRIEEMHEQGLVILDGERLRLAPERLAVSNEVFVGLLEAVGA
ncbi:MAG: radical SAM family heme chaperone HemW [Candidatus Acidiferrales bacterium]